MNGHIETKLIRICTPCLRYTISARAQNPAPQIITYRCLGSRPTL